MKKGTYILLCVLIALCVAAFFGYKVLDNLRTDTQPPEITMEDAIPQVSVTDSRDVLLQGITARDDKDGDVTDLLVVESVKLLGDDGSVQVSYAAFDRSGNVSKIQREARYTDYDSPKFTLSRALVFNYGTSFDVLSAVGATDLIDGDIQHRVRATLLDSESISELGVHDVQFQVTNSLGDMVSYVLPVEAYDPTMYDGSLTLTKYILYLSAGDRFDAKSYLDEYTLRGQTTNLRGGLPAGYTLNTTGEVRTDTPGVYPVEYRVTYTVKNGTNRDNDQHFTAYSKLIVIVEG